MNALTRDLIKLVDMTEEMMKEKEQKEGADYREKLHLMPPVGWLNDPNGLCQLNGIYHAFFQYSPFNAEGGVKMWGHYTSKDMIDWEYQGVKLYPDQPFDCHGVYSGSAFIEDDKMYVYYTGNVKLEDGDFDYINTGRESNTVLVVSEDGKTFGSKKELMRNVDYPSDLTCHVRDPKVWKDQGSYYMLLGARTRGSLGEALLYRSEDKKAWRFLKTITATEPFGYMWECPDFFPLGDKHVLICSPQNMKAEKYEFHNGNNSVYFLGNYDKNSHIFEKEEPHTIDYGLDFYAPQTTLLPDGRRVMIAWMKSWDACVVPDTQDWQGMMTLPRELEVKDGQIWQQPVRELAQYHKNPCHYEHAEIDGETALSGICGRTMDLTITMDEQDFNVFSIQLAADEEYETAFTYHKGTGILEIDRTYCGVTKDVVCVRKIKIADPKGLKKMRFILDRQSIELFINDGQQVATTAVCTPLEAEGIRFFSDKKMYITVEKYDIVL